MMKRILILLLLLLMKGYVHSSGAANQEYLLRYQLKVSTTYRYRQTLINKDAVLSSANVDIMVLSTEGEDFLIGAHSATATNCVFFFSMDEHGRIKNRKIFRQKTMPENAKVDSHVLLDTLSSLAVIEGELFNQAFWEVPEKPVTPAVPGIVATKRYHVKNIDAKQNVCVIQVWDESEQRKQPIQMRKYDLKRNVLVENVVRIDGLGWDLIFQGTESLSEATLQLLKDQCNKAIEVDRFREQTFKPFLSSENRYLKRTAYFELFQTKDETRLSSLYKQFIKNEGDIYFKDIIETFLLEHVKRGDSWAIRILLEYPLLFDFSKELVIKYGISLYDNGFEALRTLSGLSFGNDRDKWLSWYETINLAFPNFRKTTTEKLLLGVSDEDPWVRLFALKQLSEREDVDLMPILEKTANDKDENVRKCATDLLKKLKQKTEKEKSDINTQ